MFTDTQNVERNKAFDLVKIVCTVIIILHHTEFFYGILNRGYIAVEFFFIASGFFLYHSFKNKPEVSTIHYFLKRARRLYPEYWFAFLVLFIARLFVHTIPYSHWYSPILELLMLQNVGIPFEHEGINYPCWYLSVLLFGGTLVYFFLRRLSRNIFNIVATIISIGVYLFFISQSLNIEQWGTVGVFYLPFWRGMADMMIGTLIYQLPNPKKIFSIIVECGSCLAILILLRLNGRFDYLTVVFVVLLTWVIKSKDSVLKKIANLKIVNIVSKYQYGIYVNHICVILIFRCLNITTLFNFWAALAALFVCTFLLAWMGLVITKQIQKKIQTLKI